MNVSFLLPNGAFQECEERVWSANALFGAAKVFKNKKILPVPHLA